MTLIQPILWRGFLAILLLLTGCDGMRPQPIESALTHLEDSAVQQRLNLSLTRLGYAEGEVAVNLGRTGMRMELRQAQAYLHRLGYYDAPQLGILDAPTINAIDRFLADTTTSD